MKTQLQNLDFITSFIHAVEMDGDQWFVASDILAVLDLTHLGETLFSPNSLEFQDYVFTNASGQVDMLLSEGDLYKLIMRSDVPEAKAFQDWVNDVVLPEIHEDGGYFVVTNTRVRRNNAVNEKGIYKSIMRSDEPEAQAYQAWATDGALLAIRKTGGYVMGEEKFARGKLSYEEMVRMVMKVSQIKIDRLRHS